MKPCMPTALALCVLMALPTAPAAREKAGDNGTAAAVIRSTPLKQKPATDASDIATLAADTPVSIIASQGGWNQVRTQQGQQGWLRMFALRPQQPQAAATANSSSLSALGGVLRSGSSSSAATTAAKGVSPEQLMNATPNPAELARLDKQEVSTAAAQRHARNNQLATAAVAWPGTSQGVRP